MLDPDVPIAVDVDQLVHPDEIGVGDAVQRAEVTTVEIDQDIVAVDGDEVDWHEPCLSVSVVRLHYEMRHRSRDRIDHDICDLA